MIPRPAEVCLATHPQIKMETSLSIKRLAPVLLIILLATVLLSMRNADEWRPLRYNNLSQWDTYLSYLHQIGYNGKVPTDSLGNTISPVGYSKDETHVFSVLNEPGGPVLRVSGEIYGCLFTRKSY